eukprot:12099623-Alexandrium_andersonii.AAC.3
MPPENSRSRLAYASIPLRGTTVMQAENTAYRELTRAIHRVLYRQEVEFGGPWVIPMNINE